MYACIHTPAFAVQAALRFKPDLRHTPVAMLHGEPPLEKVLTTNDRAHRLGVAQGMSRLQAESFSGVNIFRRSYAEEAAATQALLASASMYSPRIEKIARKHCLEPCGTFVLDIAGSTRLFGDARTLASSLRNKAADYGLESNIAVSNNLLASACAARGLAGITVIPAAEEAAILAPLPIEVLDPSDDIAETFHTWGVKTCAHIAALPESDLIARIGIEGQRLRSLARGELKHLLVPIESSFESELVEAVTLDNPIELIDPLLFILARMIDQLLLRIQAKSLAIHSLTVSLTYATDVNLDTNVYQRTIRPALPSQDVRRLLKLIQLDLEMHPPTFAIHAVEILAVPGRPQVAQHGIFLPQSPEPGGLDILLARLRKLFGDDRVGTPQLMDTHHPDGFRITSFNPIQVEAMRGNFEHSNQPNHSLPTVFRVCRPPQAIRVALTRHQPSTVTLDGEHYTVITRAGPWRRDGQWWSHASWCREEWDVVLTPEVSLHNMARICRIAKDPSSQCWYLEGTYD